MPIIQASGSIFDSPAEALVNPVNCVGVLGAGLAKQFAQHYPLECKIYQDQCKLGKVKLGYPLFITGGSKTIVHFPTKDHWKNPSYYNSILLGLATLVGQVIMHDTKSIAIPRLGCGLGGLDWELVRPMIEKSFQNLPKVEVHLF